MKKFLTGVISLALLLSACTPQQISLVKHCQASTVLIHMKLAKEDRRGIGTCAGVYVTPNLILTADHCVDMQLDFGKKTDIQLKGVWVKNAYDKSARAEIVKTDPKRDLALLRTDLKGIPIHLARRVKTGENCWVVGMPLGFPFVVSHGIVSSIDVETDDFPINHFLTDAVVLPGNSGGGCFNSKGELIGIVTMSTSLVGIVGASGIGIVVQINEVRDFLKHVK